ncbi:catenin delta-2 isoform X1 [Diorhabda sublineata]|uniref:catenin delta-2 isoform X1 n=3 Tax=Diorhabda sublineata TaxID=1163346 RepID=UPI0024E08CC5|nr:catenin delta-2 isoform X1 [Diorhabda sublineata]XP_056646027.1 catenin delta-2 isoform X1 [Diorhabda sublineata]XP_056646028.1 catenin delta-2 isoform X1 [Diorhabda sublineata]
MSASQLLDSCVLVNRRVEQRREHSITHTEITQRRILQEQGPDMQHYKGPDASNTLSDGVYHTHSNGQSEHSPNSSHMSVHSDEPLVRTQKQQTTQQVTTVTKVVREVQRLEDQTGEYIPVSLGSYSHPSQYVDYIEQPPHHMYSQYHQHPHYQDYDHFPNPYGAYMGYSAGTERPTTPPSPSEHSGDPSPLPLTSQPNVAYVGAGYDELPEHYRVTPSPGGPIGIDPYQDDSAVVYGYVSPSPYGTAPSLSRPYVDSINGPVPVGTSMRLFEDEDLQKHVGKMSLHGHNVGLTHDRAHTIASPGSIGGDEDQRGMRWRDPNLTEVIGFLNNPNNVIKANAAAYLQHLCYMDDPNKQKTRALGGIPPLVKLLSHDSIEVYRNACGALRNLSYGRQNDENKRAIKNAGGIPALISLLRRSNEVDIKELVTGVIWNMSSCEDLKRNIIDDGVATIVTYIIIPHSGWDPQGNHGETCWSTVFRNASGVLRNVSSAGEYARKKLRECEGLVDALLFVVRCAIDKSNIGNKIVENSVCILRNLSYRCQEVEDPNYDKNPLPTQTRVAANSSKGENLGCFGGSKKKKDNQTSDSKENNFTSGAPGGMSSVSARGDPVRGMELLWQPEVVQSYLALLQSCSNPETLEAAAGALQNLAACYWQPSIEIRAAVRKEKGLPILVELLRMEVDRVVCAVATALRNLAIDQRNKELIGKYAMRDLVQKLPSGNTQHDQGTSDDTIAAVLATLNEVIKKNAEFSRSLLEAGGVERLMTITRQRQKYTPRVLKFAGQVLFTMWQHQDLRDVYKKHGWKEQDFVTKTVAARNAGPNSPNNANSTLNRPMASQSGTRYEDRTMKRTTPGNRSAGVFQRENDIPTADMPYSDNQAVLGRSYQSGPGPNPPPVSH